MSGALAFAEERDSRSSCSVAAAIPRFLTKGSQGLSSAIGGIEGRPKAF